MKKVIVVGCPGSGKSTFSQKLHNITGLPLFHLDLMFWNSDKTTVGRTVFVQRLCAAMEADAWIIDGNYNSTMEIRLQQCDTVIFLDYSMDVCLSGVRERKGKIRRDLPWVESAEEEDEEFLDFIRNFPTESRPFIIKMLEKYSYKHRIIFRDRREADAFLEQL